MKVLVDSSVWIDFLRNNATPQTQLLEQLIAEREDLCICGFVFTEVLQGIKDEKKYVATKQHLSNLIYLEDDVSTFDLGATISRELRKQGLTIRNSIDCLIAATAIQHSCHLLDADRDDELMSQHYPLHRLQNRDRL
jgi:predicted nucleic acid-binding protein